MKFIKTIIIFLFVIGLGLWLTFKWFHQSIQPVWASEEKVELNKYTATRLSNEPIIDTQLHPWLQEETEAYGYSNINGPTLITAPDWLENPLGKYYLYFAHHKGKYLRLAYADTLTGTWTMYDGKILPVQEAGLAKEPAPPLKPLAIKKYVSWSELIALAQIGKAAKAAYEERIEQNSKSSPPTTLHVASPDARVDNDAKEIRIYYHGVVEGNLQLSKVATSKDGIHFTPKKGILGNPYMRIFKHKGLYYGLAMPGFLYRSNDGLTDFEVRKRWLFDIDVRHCTLKKEGDELYIFYSRVGDAPESILYSKMDISSENWNDWKATKPQILLSPEKEWEGAILPAAPSKRGEMGETVNQLRDPYYFEDTDGKMYLLYTGGGEQGIGITSLNYTPN